MMPRFLALMGVLLLAGCHTSGYAPGRSAADLPAEINLVKLDRLVASAPPSRRPSPDDPKAPKQPAGELGALADPSPPAETRDMLAVFKKAMLEQFQVEGIRMVEDDAASPDLKVQIVVDYTPELGLYIHRSIIVDMYFTTPDGREIRKESYTDTNAFFGVLSSIVQSRDDMVAVAARRLVDQAVTEFRKRQKAGDDDANSQLAWRLPDSASYRETRGLVP